MNKKPVPQELIDIWDDHVSASKARDAAVKVYFKFQLRNAIALGRIAEQKEHEFWNGIRQLYSDLIGKQISFDRTEKMIWERIDR